MGNPVFKKCRGGLVLAGLVVFALAGCSTRPEVTSFPDLRIDPEPTPVLMTPQERDAAIEELENSADKNKGT